MFAESGVLVLAYLHCHEISRTPGRFLYTHHMVIRGKMERWVVVLLYRVE